jgi:hypothetical protein
VPRAFEPVIGSNFTITAADDVIPAANEIQLIAQGPSSAQGSDPPANNPKDLKKNDIVP